MAIFTIKGKTFGDGSNLICLPVMAKTREEIVAEVIRLRDMGADVIEWRLDAFEGAGDCNKVRQVLADLKGETAEIPLLYTFRSKQQGGLTELPADKIEDIHMIGAESGVADLVDVELFPARRPKREIAELQERGVKVVASHHDFHETPDEDVLFSILEQMEHDGADLVKLAVMPQRSADVIALLSATEEFHTTWPNTPIVTMSMGNLGKLSRVSGPLTGSCMTFGNPGKASAPGQIEYTALKDILGVLSLPR